PEGTQRVEPQPLSTQVMCGGHVVGPHGAADGISVHGSIWERASGNPESSAGSVTLVSSRIASMRDSFPWPSLLPSLDDASSRAPESRDLPPVSTRPPSPQAAT